MLSAVNANTKEQLVELSECLKKTKSCEVVATLKQFAESTTGKVQSVDIQTVTAVSKNLINVNDGLVYAELSEREGSLNDLKKIRSMWQAVLNRGTTCFMRGEANDYGIAIDLICSELENGKVYCVSFFNPSFMAGEDKGISLATPIEQFMFGIEELSLSEVEYEEELRTEAGYDSTYTDMDEDENGDTEDNDTFASRDDIISNEDLITPVKG